MHSQYSLKTNIMISCYSLPKNHKKAEYTALEINLYSVCYFN